MIVAAADPNVVVAFGAGMLSFVSPCVLPLVPGYLSLMSGMSAAELADATPATTAKVLRSTLLFVAGFTLVFTALGAGASSIGRALLDNQDTWNRVAGVAVVIMGILVAGVISPRFLMQERRFHVSPSSLGAFAPPVMGMAFAFGWTPCIGPVLGGVLSLSASESTLGRGVLLLVAYSIGLGVPFIATGLAFGRMTTAFAFMKRHFRVINLVSGALLVVFGVVLFTGTIDRIASFMIEAMDDLGLDWLARI